MNIEYALKNEENNIRITNDAKNRWLVYDFGKYFVYTRGRYAKSSKVIIETEDLSIAIEELLKS